MWYRRKNLKDNPVSSFSSRFYPICISLNLFSIAAFPKSLMVDAVFKSLIDVSYSIDSEILENEYAMTKNSVIIFIIFSHLIFPRSRASCAADFPCEET